MKQTILYAVIWAVIYLIPVWYAIAIKAIGADEYNKWTIAGFVLCVVFTVAVVAYGFRVPL